MPTSLFVALATLSLTLAPTFSGDPGVDDPAWLGCWSNADGTEVLLLEPDRVGWLRHGHAEFYRARHDDRGARLERWARVSELSLALEAERLVARLGDHEAELTRVEEVPDALRVAPYPLPTDVEHDSDTVATVTTDLRERRAADQRVRQLRSASMSRDDMAEMHAVDEDNTAFLRDLVAELGWIDAARFGREAADAAFLLVQHSGDLRLMVTALPRIEADVHAGLQEGQNFALLWDRVRLNLGHRQRYGTQLGRAPGGETVLMPCEDLAGVDERRAIMGLPPLAEYLDLFRASPDAPPIRTLEEASGS